MLTTDRRRFMRNASILAGTLILPGGRALAAPVSFTSDPFGLGVASGDPDPTSVVLWTRLAPKPLEPDFGMPPVATPVRWELADDASFRRIVRSGEVVARPEDAHAVHIVAEGLKPDSRYFYRFHAGAATSPVGRTRTLPAPGQQVSSLRFVYAACQRYENGFYGAWRHAAAENPDVILFLGDYIYENGARDGLPRRHNAELATDLATYRKRYSLYKSDKDLQAAHAAAPWVVLWDDHEVVNNYKAERSPSVADHAVFVKRRTEAYKVWYENMPVRPALAPTGSTAKIYRAIEWGQLAKFQMLDGRQYATWTDWPKRAGGEQEVILDSALRNDPTRSMLGFEQERWLQSSLAGSKAIWNVIGQQFAMCELKRADEKTGEMGFGNDSWGGFPATRERVVEMLSRVANPVVVGGDMHSFAASDLRLKDGKLVAPAFVAGAISSPSAGGYPKIQALMAGNPDFHYADNRKNGYSRVDVTAKEMVVTMRASDDVTKADTGVHDLARYAIEPGRAGAMKL